MILNLSSRAKKSDASVAKDLLLNCEIIMFKDFDVTQINKDTKVVVFRIPFCDYINSEDAMVVLENHLKKISDDLAEVGVKAVFVDDSIQVEPLTNELLNCGSLKVIE